MMKTKLKRPSRDELELEELGNKLVEAKEENSEVLLTIWGQEENVQGKIEELDASTRMVHVKHHGEVQKIPFLDIMEVESPRY